jgi:hypothetical protein
MRLLAHRGFWAAGHAGNSPAAIGAARARGFGAEIDIRDRCGTVVISHDLPDERSTPLQSLLADPVAVPRPLALNVKADGLARPVAALLAEAGLQDVFTFDMSVPDHLAWIEAGVPTLTRWSDVEPAPVLTDVSTGVWLDAMHRDLWWDAADLDRILSSGQVVALVSPELHGRPHEPLWQYLRTHQIHLLENVLLCTDFPHLAEEFFE